MSYANGQVGFRIQEMGYGGQQAGYRGQMGYGRPEMNNGPQQLMRYGGQGMGQQSSYYSQGQSDWVMIRYPGSPLPPFYLHVPSGYSQYEYPTTMTASELGLDSGGYNCGQMYGDQYNGGYSSGFRSSPQWGQYSGNSMFGQNYPGNSRRF